jgi:CRISPR-associated protein Cas2
MQKINLVVCCVMGRMMVFITEKVPLSLRGELTRWLIELKAGVFIGTLSKRVGELLWEKIQKNLKSGNAFWIQSMKTEQKFEIQSCGEKNRVVSNFEGLQLITGPNAKSKKLSEIKNNLNGNSPLTKIEDKIKKKEKKQPAWFQDYKNFPSVTWDPQGCPEFFIIRTCLFQLDEKKEFTSQYQGHSNYFEYSPETLWNYKGKLDLEICAQSLLQYLAKKSNTMMSILNTMMAIPNLSIVSLELSTTDYIPKAKQGFINIIGIVVLKFEYLNGSYQPLIEVKQIFNMVRKRHLVPMLLATVGKEINNATQLILHDAPFIIPLLNSIISEFGLKITIPSNIFDTKNFQDSPSSIDTFLSKKVNISRTFTNPLDFSKYYKIYKGTKKHGYGKQIDPLGMNNLVNCLNQLYFYLFQKY